MHCGDQLFACFYILSHLYVWFWARLHNANHHPDLCTQQQQIPKQPNYYKTPTFLAAMDHFAVSCLINCPYVSFVVKPVVSFDHTFVSTPLDDVDNNVEVLLVVVVVVVAFVSMLKVVESRRIAFFSLPH